MLNSLLINNYRAIKRLQVERLEMINLLVGANSSGKTSVLEGLRLLASGASPDVLVDILASHDEDVVTMTRDEGEDLQSELAFINLFPGRTMPVDRPYSIYVGDVAQTTFVRLDLRSYEVEEVIDESSGSPGLPVRRRKFIDEQTADLLPRNEQETGRGFQVWQDGSQVQTHFIDFQRPWRRQSSSLGSRAKFESAFVSTRFLSSTRLATLWDVVALKDDERAVIEALQIINPEIEAIAFVDGGKRNVGRSVERVPMVKLRSERKPVPMNSMGEGILRLFQLALAIHASKDGFLLIDEFENGLHYSVQAKAWNFLASVAAKQRTQIFATTHSIDCIRAFASTMADRPESGLVFRVDKEAVVDTQMLEPITTEELRLLLTSDVELR